MEITTQKYDDRIPRLAVRNGEFFLLNNILFLAIPQNNLTQVESVRGTFFINDPKNAIMFENGEAVEVFIKPETLVKLPKAVNISYEE